MAHADGVEDVACAGDAEDVSPRVADVEVAAHAGGIAGDGAGSGAEAEPAPSSAGAGGVVPFPALPPAPAPGVGGAEPAAGPEVGGGPGAAGGMSVDGGGLVAGAVWAAAALLGDNHRDGLKLLEKQRAELAQARRRLAQDIRNEERKRQRLLARAQGISDSDLLELVAVRAAAKSKAAAKAKAKAKGKAQAKGKAGPPLPPGAGGGRSE